MAGLVHFCSANELQMSHAVLGTRDFLLRHGEAAGGHQNTLILALESASKARLNAENYAYYALAAFFSPDARISLDPDDLVVLS